MQGHIEKTMDYSTVLKPVPGQNVLSSAVPAMPNMSVPGSSTGPPSGQHVTCWFQQVYYKV